MVLLLTGRAYSSAPNGPVLPIHSGVRRQQKDYLHANVSDRALFAVNRVWPHTEPCHLVLADYSTSEMLVNMGNLPLDEFYPAVSMVALMRIFRDQSLSHHHTMVVQAITFIFKSLGLKCVQFLPQVMPTFLNVIRVCDGAIREVST